MRSLAGSLLSILLAGAAVWADSATQAPTPPTAAALLARNLEARGGAERWREVQTLEIRGRFDAWSEPVPFAILRARPDRYRFDHAMLGSPLTVAWDGNRAWVQSDLFGAPGGAPLEETWKRNVIEDSAFVSRLQALGAAGAPFEVSGPVNLEGARAWVLRAKPADAPEETWYLDAATGLEIKREAMTFDVFSGNVEMPVEVFYMDFRAVDGLKLPFREERHFGTRYHLWVIESVRIDPKLEDAVFDLPKPAEPTPGS